MSALTVAFANVKGGVGKSTTAVHYAEWIRSKGNRVMLIDSDKQGSAASWAVWRQTETDNPAPEISRLYSKDLLVQVPALREHYDRIVIDTRGADGASIRAAMVVSQIVIIPVRDSDFDAAALTDVAELISEARAVNPNLRAFSFLSQFDARRSFPHEQAKYMIELGMPPLESVLHFRAVFARVSRGRTVFELGDESARVEMTNLCKEIEDELTK